MGVFIIVEGKSDSMKLKTIFPEVKTIETGGSGLTTETLNLIKKISKNNKIVIFTDPDYPGQKIRQIISFYINNNCLHAFVDKKDATDGKKVGIAEATDQALRDSLNNLVNFHNNDYSTLLWKDYVDVIDSKTKRLKVIKNLKLGFANNKTTFKWLNYMQLTKEDIINILKESA